MPEIQIVVCAPVAEIGGIQFDPATAPYAKYTKADCPRCHQAMWIGSRGRALVERGEAQMMCVVCAIQLGIYTPDTKMQKLTDRDK